MNGIMGFSMMPADPHLPKDTRDSYVKIVSSSCEQLLRIVNDIIDISKIEAGQVDLNEAPFDLKVLANEIFNFYNPIDREKSVRLEIDQLRCNFNSGSWIKAQTAYALAGDRETAITAGCSGYISKPVNRDELLNMLVAYADR
jgi:signal transduction histidine kinase